MTPHHMHAYVDSDGTPGLARILCFSDDCYGPQGISRELYPPELIGPKHLLKPAPRQRKLYSLQKGSR